MKFPYYDASAVEALLDMPGCTAAMRSAMIALSTGKREQPLRQIVQLHEQAAFGVMPGDLTAMDMFGAKLVSVFADPSHPGRTRHVGVVAAFDLRSGALQCMADAEAVTMLRTACATAAATDALARTDARTLLIFGAGTQAQAHVRALASLRPWKDVAIWGRSPEPVRELAARLTAELDIDVAAVADAREATERADVICTVTGAKQPILLGEWVRPGTHVNLVGSSHLGPVEVDGNLVARSRYVADYRPGILSQASEFAVARDGGLIDDSHVVAEIGEIFAGTRTGRQHTDQVTIYKSLGHVVQDLAAVAYVHSRATEEN